MIRENSIYSLGREQYTVPEKRFEDPYELLSLGKARRKIENMFATYNMPVVITEDVYKFRSGFGRSKKIPCLIVSHAFRGDSFKKMVVALRRKNRETQEYLIAGWYGESESDIVAQKLNSGKASQEQIYQLTDRYYAASSGEYEYYGMLSECMRAAFSQVSI